MKSLSTSLMKAPIETLTANEMQDITGGGLLNISLTGAGNANSGQFGLGANVGVDLSDLTNLLNSVLGGATGGSNNGGNGGGNTGGGLGNLGGLGDLLNGLLGGLLNVNG